MQHPSRRQPGHPYNKTREQNPFFEKVEAPRHDPKLALRSSNLNLLMTGAGIDKIKLSEALEMNIARVAEYLEGTRDFNEDVAKHVEEQLGLEPKFLDTRQPTPLEIPEKTLQILRGEFVKADEDDYSYPEAATTKTPVAQVPAVQSVTPENQKEVPPVPAAAEQVTAEPAQHASSARIHIVSPVSPVSPVSQAAPTQPRVEPADTVVPTVATPRPKVQKHSEVVIHSMAKPTQEKEVTQMISEDAMQERRRKNFNLLAQGKGAKAAIAKIMDVSAGHVTLLVQGNRAISAPLARDIETYFGLEENWLDQKPSSSLEVPQTALLAIHNKEAVKKPNHGEEQKPRRGRPRGSKNAATLEREAVEAAPVVATKRGPKPGAKKAAASAPVAQAELPLPEAVHVAAPAPAPAHAAPAVAKRKYIAPTAPAHSAPAAVAHDENTVAALLQGAAGLAPVAVALLQVIIQKANEGKFGNEQAAQLLPEILAM
jgi:plasmid maintenance system antidote protein VapI